MKIAYIVSLKKGIHRFNYREFCEMEKYFEIALFPTKFNKGLYNPKPNWELYLYNKVTTILKQQYYFLKRPFIYLSLLIESLSSASFIDFIIANDFAENMRKIGVDRIHCHFGDRKFFVGYYCKKLLGIPLTVTIHAHELSRNPNWRMFKKSLDYCDQIIAISDHNKKILIEDFGVPENKIEVIRLFVNSDEDILTKKKKILTIGSFEERKGYDVLFKAFKKLKRDDYVLWVVGSGHLPVERWAEGLNVKFFGNLHKDVLNIVMASCDFFVLASKRAKVQMTPKTNLTAPGFDQEGIPVALMEAMLAGKPVISTRHAGIPEIVDEILVEEYNVDQLAKAISYLLDHPNVYDYMGKKNISIVKKKYSIKNAKEIKKFFEHK